MSVNLSPVGGVAQQFFDNNGQPLAGGMIYTYAAGTTTPQTVYTSATGTTPHSNPIILNSAGRVPSGEIWLTDSLQYKFVVETSTGILIGTYDNIIGINSNFVNFEAQTEFATATAGQTVFTLSTINYSPGTNTLNVFIDGVKQYVGASYLETNSTTVTFTSGLHVGAQVEFTTAVTLSAGIVSATMVTYTAGFTGAVAQTVQNKLEQYVSVKDFGATGNGVTNDTAAIQAAINTGLPIVFPAGNYACGPLTQSTNFQRFYADGFVSIQKNANGVLFTSTGNYVQFEGIQFVGTGFTGNNINLTGNHPTLTNCASYGTPGRALKATGSHVQIFGTCGIYATTDATASGFDIEIGVSGTATLYHQLVSVYTSQATGGILLIDTGSHVISGGQFGKLTIQKGTAPAGVNGGMTANARILGNVNVEASNSVFTGNQFSTVTITFALGTSLHSLDTSNNLINATIVNNGNANSSIIKSIGTGSPTGIVLQYGSDAFNSTVRYSDNIISVEDADFYMPNNKSLYFYDSTGAAKIGVNFSSGDDWTFGSDTGSNFTTVSAGSVGVFLAVSGVSIAQTTSSAFRPVADGTISLGGASNRWNTVYATTGTINTSDRTAKQDISDLSAAEKRVGVKLKSLIRKFRFKDAVAVKGKDARIHAGVIAQDVEAAFAAEGLDADQYGVFCADKLENGSVRYGVRYEELLAFVIAAL